MIGKLLELLCAVVSGVSLVGLILLNFADAIGRQLSIPVSGAQEYASFLLLIFIFSSIPLLVRENSHIRVGLMANAYGKSLSLLEKYWTIIFEVLCTLLLVYLIFDFAARMDRIGTVSPHHRIAVAPFVYAAGGLAMLSLYFVFERAISIYRKQRYTGEQNSTEVSGDKK